MPQLSPEQWAKREIGGFYRWIKAQISFGIDADVLGWLKSKVEGHLSRINTILRERVTAEGKGGGSRGGRTKVLPSLCHGAQGN